MPLNFNLKKLKEQHHMSQEYLAKQLNVSRPTYIEIEKGAKELTLSQMGKLKELFGADLKGTVTVNNPKRKTKSTIKVNYDKFKEALLYILKKVIAKPNIGETALYKLLYFIDFDFYEKYGKTLIGATYIKNHHGPTPIEFKKLADEMIADDELEPVKSKYFQYDQKKYLPLREPKLEVFSAVEIQHIDDVLIRLSDKNGSELRVYSHGDFPWIAAENQAVIDYDLAFHRFPPYAQYDYDEMMDNASAEDILRDLGPMSDEEYNYYNNL